MIGRIAKMGAKMRIKWFFKLFLALNSVPASSILFMPSFAAMENGELVLIERMTVLTSAAIYIGSFSCCEVLAFLFKLFASISICFEDKLDVICFVFKNAQKHFMFLPISQRVTTFRQHGTHGHHGLWGQGRYKGRKRKICMSCTTQEIV